MIQSPAADDEVQALGFHSSLDSRLTATEPLLDRRALRRSVGAEDAAIAGSRTQKCLAARTLVVELAGVDGHGFLLSEPAFRAGQHGFETAHALLTCAWPTGIPHSSLL